MRNPSKEYIDILKGLFTVRKNNSTRLARVVFHDFPDHCLDILRLRGVDRTPAECVTAKLLLVSIVRLIINCNRIIKHRGHYHKLLDRGIDWERGISEVSAILVYIGFHYQRPLLNLRLFYVSRSALLPSALRA